MPWLNPFSKLLIFSTCDKKTRTTYTFGKGFHAKYTMQRPLCQACNQQLCAINYRRDGVTHYRARCDSCNKKQRRLKPPLARWKAAGYKKKLTCDRCGFKSKYAAQLLVYHVDGNLHNANINNLKTVCQNCAVEINKSGSTWTPGDLLPDL